MLKEDSLYNYFENNARASITTFKNIDELVSKAGNKVLVVDKEVYTSYQNSKFKDYTLLYVDTMMNDYKFMEKRKSGFL